jgi:alpha-glucosidase
LPWSGTEPPFGFSPAGAGSDPWLPQPKEWRDLTVAAEAANPDSMLRLYRAALRLRRAEPAFAETPLTWQPSPDGVLTFDRHGAGGLAAGEAGEAGATVRCIANLSAGPVPLPPNAAVLLASGPVYGGVLPPDTSVWLRIG